MTTILDLPLAEIEIPADRARALDPDWVTALSAIIAEQGLTNPITVRQVGAGYRLVAGHHRLEGVRALGRGTIAARVVDCTSDDDARLLEVMENLGRNDLIALDRCQHLYELKQVWERMYPETAHGKASPKSQTLALSSDGTPIMGFTRTTADKIGLGPAAIKLAVKIWTDLTQEARRRLVGTDLARKQTELKALSELPAATQGKVLDLILGDAPVDNVSSAIEFLRTGVKPDAIERRFEAANKVFTALPDDLLDRVLIAQEDRVIASLKRRGRI